MKKVWEVCKFSDEIVTGSLDESKFAVELHSVLDETADEIYKNAEQFLNKTYLTSQMKSILLQALKRLGSGEGQPVFIIDTEFGGGKTHTLLLLYHIFRNKELGTKYIRENGFDKDYGILEVPEAKVVTIDCRKIAKKTLWGEVANALGKYEAVREYDLAEKPIMDIKIIKDMMNSPTMILIDELPDYLLRASTQKVGETTLSDLTISFIINLISAIASLKKAMLIITLTGRQSLYKKYVDKLNDKLNIELTMNKLMESFSRQAQFNTPISHNEIYHVINRRLIKEIDEKSMNEVVKEYYEYLKKNNLTDPMFEEKLKISYPFNPFLIDTLYERVSTIDEFNKTRGLLRLLALVLHRIYKNKTDITLIGTGDIPLDDIVVRDELTSKLDKENMGQVVESDINNKAKKFDKDNKVKIYEKIARTIYIYSLIGATKISGIRSEQVKLAVADTKLTDLSLVEKALERIKEEFWYIKNVNGEYFFDKEPNINKVIYDYMKDVKEEEKRDIIKKEIEEQLKNRDTIFDKTIIWDEKDLNDNYDLKLFVLDYKKVSQDYMNELIETTSTGNVRTFCNAIVFLIPEREAVGYLENEAAKYIAIQMAKKDERIKVDKDKIKDLDGKEKEIKSNLAADIKSVYNRIAYPHSSEIIITEIKEGKDLTTQIKETLKDKGKFVEKLSPNVIEDILERYGTMKVEEIYKYFRKNRDRPIVKDILEPIKQGVKNGLFGYTKELERINDKYKAIINTEKDIGWYDYIIKKDLIYQPEIKEPEIIEEKPERKAEIIITEKPSTFIIPLQIKNYEETLGVLRSIKAGKEKIESSLTVTFADDSEEIIIKSQTKNIQKLTDLFKQLTTKYKLKEGKITIQTPKTQESDIEKDLTDFKIEYQKE